MICMPQGYGTAARKAFVESHGNTFSLLQFTTYINANIRATSKSTSTASKKKSSSKKAKEETSSDSDIDEYGSDDEGTYADLTYDDDAASEDQLSLNDDVR